MIFSDRTKYNLWQKIERYVLEFQMQDDGEENTAARLPGWFDTDFERLAELELETRHDVGAFVRWMHEKADLPWHRGLTSSDLVDTSLSVMLGNACDVLMGQWFELTEELQTLLTVHGHLPMMARTHGQPAEEITFGDKVNGWLAEINRDTLRLDRARRDLRVGKIGGAVGNHRIITPELERDVLRVLELHPDRYTTQVISRDRHAHLMVTLAILGGTLERIALSIRLHQQPEIGELFEPFYPGQVSSTAMPYKRNPIQCEKVCGLARLLRSNALVALENMALWDERDISHSSTERIIFEQSFHLICHMTSTMRNVLRDIEVDAISMRKNLR